ncbi:hypothetical protein [Delftia sp. ASV31]|jgi:hypothetical protein|uniref:hypothetical protein n=1 Tax=Delftia sp. ASV31 TaxID=2795113 RepID=UPI0018EC5369|nr:hypothetical protein [Delftia sp. ASV31]
MSSLQTIDCIRAPTIFRWLRVALSIIFLIMLASCASVRFVPEYDAESAKAITETSAEVFAFYDRLIEAKLKQGNENLPYAATADDWGKIETKIRVLTVREDSRPLNSESQQITRTILEFWVNYRAKHRDTNDYAAKISRIHRDRFQKLFIAALLAEKAKSLAEVDKNPKLDDREGL